MAVDGSHGFTRITSEPPFGFSGDVAVTRFRESGPMSLTDRSAGPVLPIGVLAMFLLVVGKVLPNSPGGLHVVWVLSWSGFGLCGLALIAMALVWTARQGRAGENFRRSARDAPEDAPAGLSTAWPHPTASPPIYHREAS
jgi:hypothetical protein